MAFWGGVYYLKENTEVSDIWNCIRELISSLPEHTPKSIFFETDNEALFWNCNNEENELVEFRFIKRLDNEKNSIKVVFDKNLKPKKDCKVHTLFYEEIAENGNLFFCWHFFPAIKKHVPKVYSEIKIMNDRQKIQKLFLGIPLFLKFEESSMGAIGTKELEAVLKTLINSLEKANQKLMPPLFYPLIQFCANENEEFFQSDWIEKLAEELWFIKAKFLKSYGVISAINKENFLKINSSLRKKEKEARKNNLLKKEFDKQFSRFISDFRNQLINGQKERLPGCYDIGLKIHVNNKIQTIPNTIKSYEELRDKIICSIDYKYLLDNELKENMPELLKEDENDDNVFQQKLAFLLKEKGFDKDSIENIINKNEELKNINTKLIKEIEVKENEIECLKNEVEHLKQELLKKDENETNSCNYVSLNNETSTLYQKNQELENENKYLKNEISSLNNRISLLENKNEKIKSDCKYYILQIPCSEKELFEREITDYLYSCLYKGIDADKRNLPENKEAEASRKRDIIEILVNEKEFDIRLSKTSQKLERIEKIIKSDSTNLESLAHEGFKEIGNNNHTKSYFYNERYKIIFSKTPSDRRIPNKVMSDIKRICFIL